MGVSNLYDNSGKVPFASALSRRVRQQAYQCFLDSMKPTAAMRILDVGVTSDDTHPESNFFEQWYPHKEQLTCVGTEDGSHLEQKYPGIRFRQVQGGEALPFSNHEFDIVFSNAVLEHVGSFARQQFFIHELCRVGRRVFVTTPNRWFPVEHHTGLPLLHYLPKGIHRPVLRRFGSYRYWSHEENLNALTLNELRRCFPTAQKPHAFYSGIGIGMLRSNLIAYT